MNRCRTGINNLSWLSLLEKPQEHHRNCCSLLIFAALRCSLFLTVSVCFSLLLFVSLASLCCSLLPFLLIFIPLCSSLLLLLFFDALTSLCCSSLLFGAQRLQKYPQDRPGFHPRPPRTAPRQPPNTIIL